LDISVSFEREDCGEMSRDTKSKKEAGEVRREEVPFNVVSRQGRGRGQGMGQGLRFCLLFFFCLG
jgi:hypothetical protein